MKIHTDKNPFLCNQCPKTFAQDCHLKEHLGSVHTGEKLQPCKLCTKFVTLIGNLNTHIKVHTSEKFYQW